MAAGRILGLAMAFFALLMRDAAAAEVTEVYGGGDARWRLWNSDHPVHLALYRKAERPVWSKDWPDAYDAQILRPKGWVYNGHPIVAVTMQFGAAAEQVDLFGLGPGERPVLLAEKLAATIDWPEGTNELQLRDASAGTLLPPRCFVWRVTGRLGELQSKPCHRIAADP